MKNRIVLGCIVLLSSCFFCTSTEDKSIAHREEVLQDVVAPKDEPADPGVCVEPQVSVEDEQVKFNYCSCELISTEKCEAVRCDPGLHESEVCQCVEE